MGEDPEWLLVSGSDRRALDIVDGMGLFAGCGPHYSRRTPGSKTFTGIGKEVVMLHRSGRAVWAVVLARIPSPRGTTGVKGRYLWRNMLFRNLGAGGLSSDLIRSAVCYTILHWDEKYGSIPDLPLRTEVDTRKIKSCNPGYCYKMAGWIPGGTVRGKLYLYAPDINEDHIDHPSSR